MNLTTNKSIRKYLLYALGEILLVMIGILLALQVNNWNQERQNREREKLILADLHEEFLNNKEQLETVLNGHLNSYQSSKWLLDHHGEYTDLPQDSVIHHFKLLLSAFTFNPSQSGIRALMNTSSFELIRNRELRKRLLLWTDQYRDYAEDEEASKASLFNDIIPYLNEYGDFRLFSPNNVISENADLSIYNTLQFRNQLHIRNVYLNQILFSQEREREIMQDNMNAIIDLTASPK